MSERVELSFYPFRWFSLIKLLVTNILRNHLLKLKID